MMKVTAISIWVLCLFCSELALTGALFCWECTQIANTSDCHLARECPDHNQCGTPTQYQVGAIVGRAMVDVTCSQCCSQNTCNRALCSPSTHNPVTNSTCADTKDFDCPTVSAAISLCADIDRAKKVCKKWCDLCEIDGGWSQWTPWTGCDVTCSTGKMTRHRSCTNPAPKNGGVDCVGNSTMFKSCTTPACPVHGGWTRWSPWGSCSVTCGVGLRRRDRTCSNPYTSAGGDYCSGDTRDDKICFERSCADGGWTGWAAWGSCSVSCGGGMKSRSRSCTSPAPSTFGKQCPGDSHEAAICQIEPCNATNGGWSSWSNWNDCSESCGSGVKGRTRTCDSPLPSSNGRPCTGNSQDVTSCNTKQCPTPATNGAWSSWSNWHDCSESCDSGVKSRTRTCDSPSPSSKGRPCTGNSQDVTSCNTKQCPTPVRLVDLYYESRRGHLCGVYGHVQVYVSGRWGLICGNSFSTVTATVVCRILGYRGTSTVSTAPPISRHTTIQLRNLDCQGNETDIMQCPVSHVGPPYCHNDKAMRVLCRYTYSYCDF